MVLLVNNILRFIKIINNQSKGKTEGHWGVLSTHLLVVAMTMMVMSVVQRALYLTTGTTVADTGDAMESETQKDSFICFAI